MPEHAGTAVLAHPGGQLLGVASSEIETFWRVMEGLRLSWGPTAGLHRVKELDPVNSPCLVLLMW